MSKTRGLAEYAAAACYNDLGMDTREKTKQLILDTIGCTLGGYQLEVGKLLVQFAKEMGGPAESTIIGEKFKVLCKHAAFVNAQVGRALDFDETYKNSGHPGVPTVQAALAMAERQGSTGKDVINAVTVGYEVAGRVGDAMNPSLKRRKTGVYPFATWEILGAAVACSKLMKLNAEQMYNAICIAASTTTLPTGGKNHDAPMGLVKCREGWHAEDGVLAALLASKGFTGVHEILDEDTGFGICAGSDRWEWRSLTDDLGKSYQIMNASFKAQPVCRLINISIEAAMAAIKEGEIRVEEIEKIEIGSSHAATWSSYNNRKPIYGGAMRSAVSAQFSIQWGITMTVLGYEPGPEWFVQERFDDPEVLDFCSKIEVGVDPEADRLFEEDSLHAVAIAKVTAKGKTFKARVDYAKGDPTRPIKWDELVKKFHSLAKFLGESKSHELAESLQKIEEISNLEDILLLCSEEV